MVRLGNFEEGQGRVAMGLQEEGRCNSEEWTGSVCTVLRGPPVLAFVCSFFVVRWRSFGEQKSCVVTGGEGKRELCVRNMRIADAMRISANCWFGVNANAQCIFFSTDVGGFMSGYV